MKVRIVIYKNGEIVADLTKQTTEKEIASMIAEMNQRNASGKGSVVMNESTDLITFVVDK